MEEDNLSDIEKKIFNDLAKEAEASEALKSHVVQQLRTEGYIKSNSPAGYLRWTLRIAASVLIFAAGVYYGKQSATEKPAVTKSRQGYIMLLHEGPLFKPGDGQQMFMEYGKWARDQFAKGVKISGEELTYDQIQINPSRQVERTDKKTDVISGYFIFEAATESDAVAIALSSPHLQYGGTIELRSIQTR